ncbi:glycosyltransferase family protein [Dermacoccaceae bacterium W4C1]
MLYSHDSVGLGHLRRNLAIAHALAAQLPGLTGREVTGLLITGVDRTVGHLPAGFDIIRLPGVTRGGEGYTPRQMSLPMPEMTTMRSATISAALLGFAPDLVIVDRHAFGVDNELLAPLRLLRRQFPQTRIVLGLRDVLDSPAVAEREWRRVGVAKVREVYDRIWVYGDRVTHDVCVSGEVPRGLHRMSEHTGLLAQGRATVPGAAEIGRSPYVLTLVGGGSDGLDLCLTAAAAKVPAGMEHLLVTGPQMSERDRAKVVAAAGPQTRVVASVPDGLVTIRGAQAVTCMGGYNTVCEVLSTDVPALVAPRSFPRREQVIRAEALARRGLVEVAGPDARPGDITAWWGRVVGTRVDRSIADREGLGRLGSLTAGLLNAELVGHVI